MMWTELSRLHDELLKQVAEHEQLCANEAPARGALSGSRWRVAQAGRARMDYLHSTVFPFAERNVGMVGRERLDALRDSTPAYQRQISSYVSKWPTEVIVASWGSYQVEAKAFRAAILARIAEEAAVLRPILRQAELLQRD